MADINVERKRTSMWTWIAGLVVAALLVWALLVLFGGDGAAVEGSGPGSVGIHDSPAPSLAVGLRIT